MCFFMVCLSPTYFISKLSILFVRLNSHLCHSYRFSPPFQGYPSIFDNPISLKWRNEVWVYQSLGLPHWACKLAGTVEQLGVYNFYIKRKNKKQKTKFHLVKPGAQLSILDCCPFLSLSLSFHKRTIMCAFKCTFTTCS